MLFDLSVFLSKENILFSAIYLGLILIVAFICFLVVRAVLKLIIKIFKKIFHIRKPNIDKGENVELVVEELAKSKLETQKVPGPSPTVQFNTPVSTRSQDVKVPELSEKEKREQKDEADISSDLKKIEQKAKQGVSEESEEERVMGSKIKIPVAKKYVEKVEQRPESAVKEAKNNAISYNQGPKIEQGVVPRQKEEKQENQTYEEENLSPLEKELHKVYEKADSGKNYQLAQQAGTQKQNASIGNKSREESPSQVSIKSSGASDSSIFGGKKEISRSEMREKLRKDSRVWQAEREVGMTLSPVERSKLEKQVFSQMLGRDISKTDMKFSINKLNRKMMASKDPVEKGKLRKEIKFFKKIGGIK
jgi:hypothetical protein